MTDEQYGEWAYRGEAVDYTGTPMDLSQMGYAARRARSFDRLPRLGAQCGEFLFSSDGSAFEFSWMEGQVRALRRQGGTAWSGLSDPAVLVHIVRKLSVWVSVVFVITSAMFLIDSGIETSVRSELAVIAIPVFIYLFCSFLIKIDAIPHRNSTIFHRDTGMIEIPKGWFKQPEYLPFAEFEPHVFAFTPWTGVTRYRLLLAHRQSERIVLTPGGGDVHKASVAVDWERLQQYMDVTRPLPEVPDLEGVRGDDPTTVAWDAANGRPDQLWPRMTYGGFNFLQKASREPARTFPWGVTRREAYAQGWRPSPHGMLVGGEISYGDFVAWLKEQGYWNEDADAGHGAPATVDEPQRRAQP